MQPDTNHATKLAYSVEEACKTSSLGPNDPLFAYGGRPPAFASTLVGGQLIQAESLRAASSMANAKASR